MNLKNIVLNKRSQTQEATYCIIPFIWNSGKGKVKETEIRWVVGCEGLGYRQGINFELALEKFFRAIEMFHIRNVMAVTCLSKFIELDIFKKIFIEFYLIELPDWIDLSKRKGREKKRKEKRKEGGKDGKAKAAKNRYINILYIYIYFFSFLGPRLRHMEVPRLGIESEL